jgi:hypothetical protein
VVALEEGRLLAKGTVAQVRSQVPGLVAEVSAGFDHPYRWRRGSRWRAWFPDGSPTEGVSRIDPDLTDLITAAAYARRSEASK